MLVFLIVAGSYAYMAALDTHLSDTQINIASAAVKRHQPDLFAHDPIFGAAEGTELWRFHTPAFQSLLEMVLVPTDYADPTLPFRVLTGIVALAYMCSMYALLYRQCKSWSASAFVAVLSSTVTYTLGRAYWGAGSLASIEPATLYTAIIPLIVLAFLRYSDQWRIVLVFLFVGLCGNLHLVTTMNLTIMLLIVYLGRKRFAPSAWPMAVMCGLFALIGALPYALYYFALTWQMTPPDTHVSTQAVYMAFAIGKLAVLYPQMLPEALNWGLAVVVLAIPAGATLLKVERYRVRDLGVWVWFVGAGAGVAFGLHGASQLYGAWRGAAPPVIDFVGASRLIMLPLYVLFAHGLTTLFRLVGTHRAPVRWACAALLVAWMVPSDNLRIARRAGRRAIYDVAAAVMSDVQEPKRLATLRRRRRGQEELAAIARWARENTGIDAVFITDRIAFRMLARRGIVASRWDVKYVYYMAPWRLDEWTARMKRQNRLLRPSSGSGGGEDELANFVAELSASPAFRGAQEWYAIIRTNGEATEATTTRPVESGQWGEYYKVYRLR